MTRAGFVTRFLKPCAVAAFLGFLAACGGGGGGGEPVRTVTTVTVSSPTSTPKQGDTVQLTAVARDQFGDVVPGTTAAWSSSAPAVATVSATGMLQALAGGSVTVTATISGVSGTLTLVVTPRTVTTVTVTSPTLTPQVGSTVQLAAEARDQFGDLVTGRTAMWSTSAPSIGTVSATGLLQALAPGAVTATATVDGVPGTLSLMVTPRTLPQLALFAGSVGGAGHVDGADTMARFASPTGAAVDSAGNVYVADTGNEVIRKITPAGVASTLAGSRGAAGSSDGPAAEARLSRPTGVAVDERGNVYVADTGNHSIRRITPTGLVSTVAGVAGAPGSDDGRAAQARFRSPQGVAVDGAGNVYVADTGNYTVRRIAPDGVVSTVAGAAGAVGSTDGPGTEARFGACVYATPGGSKYCWGPAALTIDRSGNLLVADAGNYTIRVMSSSTGAVSTLPGTFYNCSISGSASLCIGPTAVAADGEGSVYAVVANTGSSPWSRAVYRIAPTGEATRVPGMFEDTGWMGYFFTSASGIATDRAGNVYLPDTLSHTIRKLPAGGEPVTLAGSPLLYGVADGSSEQARFGGCFFSMHMNFDCLGPTAVTVDTGGNVYVADRQNHTIRKITAAGVVSTLAGRPGQSGSADGSLQEARFFLPTGVAVDGAGNLYVSDSGNSTIRRISPAGGITTLAGKAGEGAGSSDGVGSQARFSRPTGVATDRGGNLFVADSGNSTIRRINPAGEVTTLAGQAGQRGSSDGTGAQARFDLPDSGSQFLGASGLATDGAGNVYVADTNNHSVRRITPEGVVTTLAGSAGQRGSADGTGSEARFDRPQGVATDSGGNVYVADTGNHAIRKITADGVVSTVVGRPGYAGFLSGSLPGGLTSPVGVASSGTTLFVVMPNGVVVVNDLR